jgi:hypothetical protein
MKKNTRNVLIILGMVGLVFIGAIGYGVYKVYSLFSSTGLTREMPDAIKEARILKGEKFLTKTEMFKMEEQAFLKTIGEITKTQNGKERQKITQKLAAREIFHFSDIKVNGDEIVAVGNSGGFVFDLHGILKREIFFQPSEEKIKIGGYEQAVYQPNSNKLKIVELEKNRLGFFSFDIIQGFKVFDINGKQIWVYGKDKIDLSILWQDNKKQRIDERKYVMGAAVGDLDGDGFAEYVVAVHNDGIRAFDRHGIEKWFQPEKFPRSPLQIVDIDGDGKNELLEIGAELKIRDANGRITRELKSGGWDPAILFCENGNKKQSIDFCNIFENRMKCVDENENIVMEAAAPLSDIPKKHPHKITVPGHPEASFMDDIERAAYPKAVWVAFKKDKPKYLAVVHSFIGLSRSLFYLYDDKGNLVYHELLPEDAQTIAVIPSANENQEILVGGKRTIWKYELN